MTSGEYPDTVDHQDELLTGRQLSMGCNIDEAAPMSGPSRVLNDQVFPSHGSPWWQKLMKQNGAVLIQAMNVP